MAPLLKVEQLHIGFGPLEPLAGVDLAVERGRILGLVGESGSGKSMTAMSVMGLLPLMGGRITSGRVLFDGTDLTGISETAYRNLRGGRIALITQNPMTSLDPVMRVGRQVDQVAELHLNLDRKAAKEKTIGLMARMRIPSPDVTYHLVPHQLSGGLRQRIVIAMALAGDPDLLIADEPTTALDVTVQAQIIALLSELVREKGLGLILITHDMGVVAQICDDVAVMYCGKVVEYGEVNAIFDAPRHPYTGALIGCIPQPGMTPRSLAGIPGMVPSASAMPDGCRYNPRCPLAIDICRTSSPPSVIEAGRSVACFLAEEDRA
ncbi:ABC transporter ATP-binding protein [Rhizobium sp. CG5]|uniref:ABC transporter ATP-binding protein n=1 Tax=Rhizobium sp. CG5 TaxID=2726076 RepID=UPI002033E1D5|nr:ABC transporter ATP-binding protein [Rhizobium sp. CG5]MCM2475417.1 ABC transporter ATP-binding protein [Rhizobium sp. CG5]